MEKLRVYEYARNQQISSKEVIEILKRLDIPVSNHMSVMDKKMMEQVEEYMARLKANQAEPAKEPAKEKEGSKPAKKETSPNKEKQSKIKAAKPQGKQRHRGNDKMDTHDDDVAPRKVKVKKSRPNEDEQRDFPLVTRKKKKGRVKTKPSAQAEAEAAETKEENKHIVISGPITVGELAKKLNKPHAEIIKKLMFLGIMANINQVLEIEAITLIAEEYGVTVEEKIEVDETQFEQIIEEDDPASLEERPPVVTVMGHVDHGKTTLLDSIRKTRVTAQEAGGITQHIGAYQVKYNDKKITFLDTPGHEAFTTMRARGAQVTDIAIIVVAADDGVMPQTREAIAHAQAAKVPIIVAINKMDKPEANPEKIKQELSELNLIPEEWGGDTIFVPISALKNEGLDELMEMILLVAEMEELKANPHARASGTVIEAKLDKGRGPVATVLVQRGTLNVGDPIVVGNTYGKVRAMVNDQGKRIKSATPSTPVEITGLNDVPQAGDAFKVFEDEKKARMIGEQRAMRQRESELNASAKVSLDDLFQQIQEGDIKEINVIIKADVQGTAEVLKASLEKIEVEGVRVKIIHAGVGAITESDVVLASASNAIIIGFNVRPEPTAKSMAEQEKVDIRLHRVIYKVMEEIESAMKGLLDPVYEEKVIGTVEVRQIFKGSKVGTIAGSYVMDGKVTRDSLVRVIRDGIVIHEGKIDELKRFKDDVKEVAAGYECGITIQNYNDIKEGDIIEAYIMEEIKR